MAQDLVKFASGEQADYDSIQTKDADTIYFCTDSQRLFLGSIEYTRPIVIGNTAPNADSAETAPKYSLYFDRDSQDGGNLYYTDGTAWNLIYSLSNITDALNDRITNISSSNGNINFVKEGSETSFPHPAIYTVKGTQTAATNKWTGNIPINALYDGLCIAYYLPYAGTSSAATLKLTLVGPNGTGTATTEEIAVYALNNTAQTTHYGAGSTIFLTYWGAGSISVAGTVTAAPSWRSFNYYQANSNDTSADYERFAYSQFAPTTALHRYIISLPHPTDSHLVIPANTTNNTIANTKTTITTEAFNPFEKFIYYSTTTNISANANVSTSYMWYAHSNINLQYSFNTGSTLVAHKNVYLVAQMQSDGSAKLRNPGATGTNASAQATGANAGPITQILPSTDDGYIYIKLGRAASTTNIAMTADHPIYIFKNGVLTTYTGYAANAENLKHSLTIGSYVFDGSQDVTIPIYDGTIVNS